jgi:hypothetical protein
MPREVIYRISYKKPLIEYIPADTRRGSYSRIADWEIKVFATTNFDPESNMNELGVTFVNDEYGNLLFVPWHNVIGIQINP